MKKKIKMNSLTNSKGKGTILLVKGIKDIRKSIKKGQFLLLLGKMSQILSYRLKRLYVLNPLPKRRRKNS